MLRYWLVIKIRGKTKDLTPQKISGVKMLIDTKNYSNREICRTLEISESSVSWIKKKINLGEELCPERTNKCGRKSIFTLRSERWLKKVCLVNHSDNSSWQYVVNNMKIHSSARYGKKPKSSRWLSRKVNMFVYNFSQ